MNTRNNPGNAPTFQQERRKVRRDMPPENEAISLAQANDRHYTNVRAIQSNTSEILALRENFEKLSLDMAALKSDTAEIVEWTRNAKLTAKLTAKISHKIGLFLRWSVKALAIIATLWFAFTALREGKMPTFFP